MNAGSYNLLPSVIEESFTGERVVTPERKITAIQIMDQTLRSQLLKVHFL